MSDQLRKSQAQSFLLKKGASFKELYQRCKDKLKQIREKNNVFSSKAGTDLEDDVRREINRQIQTMKRDLGKIKDLLEDMEKNNKDTESKAKIKEIKQECFLQTDRLLRLTKEFVVKSFLKMSTSQASDANTQRELLGGAQDFVQVPRKAQTQESRQVQKVSDYQYDIEQRLAREKEEIINKAEKDIMGIKDFIEESARMIYSQREDIQLIADNIANTHKNAIVAKEQTSEASRLQQGGVRKYIWLLVVVLLLGGVTVGIVLVVK